MKTIVHEIPYSPASNLDEEIFTASSVFFDIETTGFSPAHTSLYLIGCAYHIEQMLYIKQFFAETPEEESRLWRRTVMGRCGAFCLRQDNNLQMYSILTYVDLRAILLLLK